MNIRGLKTLIGNLPDEITAEQFELITNDVADLTAQAEAETKDELDAILARVAMLQARLGAKPAPVHVQQPAAEAPLLTRRRAQRGEDFTDADLGLSDDDDDNGGDEMTMGQFQSELRSARASGVAKRRNLS